MEGPAQQPDTQDVLIAGVKTAVGALTRRTLGVPEEGSAEAQPIPKVLDDKVKEVRALLDAVEQALFHGLRVEEFKGVFPFWALLERLEGAIQPTDHKFNNVIAAVAVVPCLRGPIGRSRGWVRQALNTKQLNHCLTVLCEQQKYMVAFWKQNALLRSKHVDTLRALFESLEQFDIMATIEMPDLNDKPTWKILKDEPLPPPPLAPPSSTPPSTSGGGGWVPPRDKWIGGGGESESSSRPGWWSALEEKIWGDEEEAAAWRAKAKAAVEQGVATLGTAVVDLRQRTADATQAAREAREARQLDTLKREKGDPVKGEGIGGRVNAMLKKGEKEPPLNGLWGFPLARLVRSDKHCELAFLSPGAAVPDAAVSMINALDESMETPGLFRKPVSSAALNAVRTYFDNNPRAIVPPGYDPHVVAASLVALLAAMKEPLLTFERYDAFVACGALRGETQGALISNLRNLLPTLPYSHKPLLAKLFALLHRCAAPGCGASSANGTNPMLIALVFAPAVLRGKKVKSTTLAASPRSQGGKDECDEDEDANAALAEGMGDDGAVEVVKTLVEYWPSIGCELEDELVELERKLQVKCQRLEAYQADLSVVLDPLSYVEHKEALEELSNALKATDDLIFMERKAAFEARKQAKRLAKENARAEKMAAIEAAKKAKVEAKLAKQKAKVEAKLAKKQEKERAKLERKKAKEASKLLAKKEDKVKEVASSELTEEIESVTMMGFSEEWAKFALKQTNNDSDAAVDFILEHITDMDELTKADCESNNNIEETSVEKEVEEEEEDDDADTLANVVEQIEMDQDDNEVEEEFVYDMSEKGRLWRCGFSGQTDSSDGFSSADELRGGGLLVVKCLTHFLKKHSATAPTILAHASRRSSKKPIKSMQRDEGDAPALGSSGEGGVSVGAVCVQCLRSVATVLRLTPTPTFSDVSVAAVARTAVWKLLDYQLLVENMFALALHIFDDQTTGGVVGLGDRVGTMERCLSNLVHQRKAATSPSDIWLEWSSAANDRPDMEGKILNIKSPRTAAEEEAVGVEF